MRAPSWLIGREESRARAAALLPLRAASWGYAAGASLHRLAHQRGWIEPRRLACRVVSVGSLTVGGAGKTPTAAFVAEGLRLRGHRVALATRGHGGRPRESVHVLSDGRLLGRDPGAAGDEPIVLAAHAPGVPVVVARDRGLAGLRAISVFDIDVLVLDDGFQHHRLHRDVDILSFDGMQGLGNGFVLPRGPLREGVSALERADAIGVVDGALPPADEAVLARRARAAYRYTGMRQPIVLHGLAGGDPERPTALAGRSVGALTGIAGPAEFECTLEALGARVVARRHFPDHHRYRSMDLRGLSELAEIWVTTEKDAVKLLPSWLGGLDLRVLTIEIAVEGGDAFFAWLEGRLRASDQSR
jgi:tetraacyldisaccharide 4'-kinase